MNHYDAGYFLARYFGQAYFGAGTRLQFRAVAGAVYQAGATTGQNYNAGPIMAEVQQQ